MSNKNHNNRQNNTTTETPVSNTVEKVISEATPEVTDNTQTENTENTETVEGSVENVTNVPEEKVEENNIPEKEDKKEEPFQEPKCDNTSKVLASAIVTSEEPTQKDMSIKVGTTVMLKNSVKTTVTGTPIPSYAYRNVYKVKKILPSRIILKAGVYEIAVTKDDVIIQ